MNIKFNFIKITHSINFFAIFFIAIFLFFVSSKSVDAAVRTWDGSSDAYWSNPANWGGTAPVTGDDLVFPSGSSNISNTNDLTENTIINSITMSGSGYTLSGNRIILGQGLAGITDSAASGGNTIALDIRMDVTRDIVVVNTSESLTISGRISGVGGINKEGTGTLILSGSNTYGGTTKINVGVVNARNSTALGSIALGTEVVGSAALELQGGISIGYEALALRGWGFSGTSGALRNISGTNTYGGLITLSSAGGTIIKSDSGTLTITGGTTGNAPLIFDGSGDMVFSTAPISGNSTITKNGSGTVTYNFPNSNSGLLTINQGTILYGVNNAIAGGAVTVAGGTLDIATFSDMVGAVTLGTLDLASGTITGTTGMLSATLYTVYQGTISAIIAGNAATLTKSTNGTVVLTRANQYTGQVSINAGILEIQDSFALGLIDGSTAVAAGGTLQINGNGLSVPEYISSLAGTGHLYTGAIRNKTGNNSITGHITLTALSRIVSDEGTTLTVDEKGLYVSGSANLTIGGEGNIVFTPTAPLYGTGGSLTKNGNGVLTIESFSNFAGTTNLLRGEVVLSGSGAIPGSAITIGSGGALTLDNSSTAILNRISDTSALTMNGGNFNFIGNASGTASETAGALTSTTGHNIVTVTPGSGGDSIMRFASLSRSAGSSLLFRGTNLGSAPGPGVSTIMFTSAPTVIGAGGSAGTTTASIIKGAFGDSSLSGTGSDMVVYNLGNTNGIRLLNSAGFSGEYAFTLATNANVKLSGNATASTASINSLISNGYDITNASATITMASASLAGNILINSTNNIAGPNTTIGITTFELNVLSTASSTISAVIGTAVAGSLAVSGPGNVTLSSVNLFTGATNVNNATLTYGVSNALSTGGINVVGGTLDIAGNSDTVGAIVLQNGTITGGAGILSGSSYSFREGTVSAILGGSGTVNVIATNAPADAVVNVTRDNTYTGTTTISSGILRLGATGGGTNTPLGTTGGGTLIVNSGALDLNGYTLGTAEAITSLAGTGFGPSGSSNMGAIMNTSNTPASYNGPITMSTNSRINADYGALTINGSISGTFALIIGGMSNSILSGVVGIGAATLTKEGPGTLTLSNSNTYTGGTFVTSGTLRLGSSGGATNTPLGTVAGATTISNGARLDLNGFTLGTAEPLTLNGPGFGLGDFSSGALINSSATGVTFSGLITLGSASVIKADYGDINLTAAGTITGSGSGLTIGGTGNGTLSSVVGTVAGQLFKIGTGTWTISGQSTYTGATSVNLGKLKLGANGGATNTPIGTSAGGVTVYSGAVLDFNGFTIPTAEALTINGFGINDSSAIIGSNGTFGGTIVLASESGITNASGTMTITGAVSGAFLLHVDGAGNITTSTAFPTAGTSISKHGAGTLTVTGTNLYTGATRVEAGTFAYAATTTLAGTPLTVLGGTFNSGANTDTIGTVTLVGGTIANSAALTATAYTLESGTISGILAGAVAVTKNTNNTVTLTGVNTISSTTTINAGTLVIGGSGSAVSTTITVNLGGTLTLDNSTTAVASRLGDALALSMNGGNFNFIGNGAGSSSETTGALSMLSGHNTVTVTPGAGGSTTMTFASFSRSAGATGLFRGTNFESTAGSNVSTLIFTAAPTLTGAGGGAGTTTMSVLKGAFGDTSLSGKGSDMVTVVSNKLRPLASGEYSTTLTANANVKLASNTVASTVNVNSLVLNGFDITNPGSAQTITIASASLAGNILINSANNIAGANTTIGFGALELSILATNNSTISATLNTASAGPVLLSGSGNVTFTASNAYTGTTYINGATLTAGANNVISSGWVTIVGGTYNLNGNSDTVGNISLNAGTITTGAGTLTGNGTFTTIANNNVSSYITGNLGLGANATLTINDGLMDNDAIFTAVISGAFTLGKAGSGVLILSGNNTYSGATTISAGMIRLGATGDATNTPLGTIAGGTTVTGATSALDLNGYTLATAETLTLSGALATGAIQNNSSSAVNYIGLITLGAASTIIANYGDINITNTGNITGNTFALTIGGAGNGSLSSNLNTTTGTLTKNGLGLWTISGGASTYTGLTTISAGTIKLGVAGSGSNTPFGTVAGGITISATGILDLNGLTLATAEPIGSMNGTGLAGIGAFINTSNNTISYSGPITLVAASRIANYGNGTVTLSGNISGNFALTVVSVGSFIQATNSIRSGTSTIVKEGPGLLVLSGQNTFTGAVTVSTGTLRLGASGGATNTPLGTNAGGVVVSSGAVLDLSTFTLGGASTYETLNLSGTGIKNSGALISSASGNNNFGATTITANSSVINSGSGLITFGGTITSGSNINLWIGGSGPTTISGVYGATATTATITKADSGTLVMGAASITTGLVRINGGTLQYGVNDALSTPAVTVAGGTLNLAGFNETNIGAVTLIDGSIVNSGGAATLISTASYTVERGTISAVLGSAVATGIIKITAGRFIMSGNNTFTSTAIVVHSGYFKLGHSNALGASGTASTTTINGGATLELEGGITIPSTKAITVHGTGFNNSGAIKNVSGSNSIGANVTLGSTNVRINSDSGTLSFPTISGNTFNSIFGGSGDVSVTGIIGTTSGGLTKDGSGNLTLAGANTYTGATTLIGGTLFANATNAIGTGVATNTLVFNGGTLQATGTIVSPVARAVTLMSGGGTINTNGNNVSIAGTVGSAGGLTKSGAGTLTITGATTIGGDLTISAGTFVAPTSMIINGNFNNSGTYTHSNGTVTLTPTNPSLTTNISGNSDTVFYNLTNTTPNSTLTFKAGNTYTFSNVLTLVGSDGSPMLVNSDTPGSRWFMTLSGSASASHLKVKDSGCVSGNNVDASSNIYDYGNNGSCWSFIYVHYGGGGGGHVELSATPDADVTGGAGGGEGGAGATTAIGAVIISANVVQSVTIDSGGNGYLSAPSVLFCGGGGSGALGTAVLSGDSVSSVTVDNGGSGYITEPTIVFDSSCPVSGGSGGGGGSTGDLGFFYNAKKVFALLGATAFGSFSGYMFY